MSIKPQKRETLQSKINNKKKYKTCNENICYKLLLKKETG